MTPTPYQKFRQKTRRIWQQSSSDFRYIKQLIQVSLLQKLYERNGLELHLTCSACPEQYDVCCGITKIAYLRLRGGQFTVEYPCVMGELLFYGHPEGDGMFEDYERFNFMCMALRSIKKRIENVSFIENALSDSQ